MRGTARSPEREHRPKSARSSGISFKRELQELANSRLKLSSRRMVARRPSRLELRFRTAARPLRAGLKIGQAARRASVRRVKPARSLGEGR